MTTSSTTTPPAPKPRLTEKQAKRAGQSAMAMVLSVLATLAVALMVYFLNPGSTAETYERPVDVDAVATQATAVWTTPRSPLRSPRAGAPPTPGCAVAVRTRCRPGRPGT